MASRLETGSRAEAKREQVLAGARRVFLRDGFAAAQDGTLSDGQGVTSVQKITSANLPQVRYRVTFDRDVSRCANVATVGTRAQAIPGSGRTRCRLKAAPLQRGQRHPRRYKLPGGYPYRIAVPPGGGLLEESDGGRPSRQESKQMKGAYIKVQ